MQVETILDEFLNGKTDNIDQLINELSLYIAKVFYKTKLFSELDEIKSEITIFLYQKKDAFLRYDNARWEIVKKSAINYFKDILKQKRVQLIETQEDDLVSTIDKKAKHHTELSYVEKLEALQKQEAFYNAFSDKEKFVLLDILGEFTYPYVSKQTEYKTKERLRKKLKNIILRLKLDYETADLVLDLFCSKMKSRNEAQIVNKTEGKTIK